ncbi:hypothetical protein N5I42_27170, partial [Klebsiella pneumoniae]|nr:hypothetical protein [Klebsiella pneumoniae]
FREQIAHQPERAQAYSVNFRTAQRFGLVTVIEKPVVFWFEAYDASKELEPSFLIFWHTGRLIRIEVCCLFLD